MLLTVRKVIAIVTFSTASFCETTSNSSDSKRMTVLVPEVSEAGIADTGYFISPAWRKYMARIPANIRGYRLKLISLGANDSRVCLVLYDLCEECLQVGVLFRHKYWLINGVLAIGSDLVVHVGLDHIRECSRVIGKF